MSEPRKGTCSVCRAPATYYGDVSQYCISDYAKLQAINKEYHEYLRDYVQKISAKKPKYLGFHLADALVKDHQELEAEILDLKQEVAILRKDNDNHVKRYKEMSKV